MHHHQPNQPPIDRAPLGQTHRNRRQERHSGRSDRPQHGWRRRNREDHPRHQRPAAAREADGLVDDPRDGPIALGDREEIRDAGEKHEQVHRKSLVHRRRRLARGQGPDKKRHHEREHAEIDRAQRADGKNDDETEEACEVDGHVSQSRYRQERSARTSRLDYPLSNGETSDGAAYEARRKTFERKRIAEACPSNGFIK